MFGTEVPRASALHEAATWRASMNFRRTGSVAVFLLIALAGCAKEEEYQSVSEDQLNHYAGIEALDHPVENVVANLPGKGEQAKPGSEHAFQLTNMESCTPCTIGRAPSREGWGQAG